MPPPKKKRPAARQPQRRPASRPATKRSPQGAPPRSRQATAPGWQPTLPAWPLWVWAWLVLTAFFFILRAGGAIQSVPLCFFLSSIAGALCFSLDQLRAVGPAHPWLRTRQVVLIVVIVAIPSLFDPTTIEIENLPRLVLLTVAAVLILAIWAVDAVWSGWRPRRLVNGFQWVLLAIVVWFGVTTLASVEPRQSLLGRYGSYEGFILLAALAVLSSALAESFTLDALPALFRVVVAATVPVVVYGLIQVHDYVLDKHSPWDFVQWHHAYVNVFTTLGNPNHLAGFLVTILPIGVVTAVLARHRWVRIALWVWVAVVAALVLQTDARGAWLGTLASGAILVVGMLPRLRANVRTVAIAVGGGLVIAVALIASGSRFLGAKAAALFQFGPGSSVSQRYGYWSAAIRIGVHHPLVGTGPDTYAVSYARYQDAALAKLLGSTYFVNGAHNIFLAWLANEGFPGFLLIVALFALGIAWGVRAWATLGKKSSDPETSEAPERGPAELRRYMVAALVAGLVAYFVQASFDVDQVATLFAMFLVLGLLGVVNRGVWPLPTLVAPFSAFRGAKTEGDMQRAEEDSDYPAHITRGGVYGRSASAARRRLQRATTAFAVGAVGLTAVGLTFWRTDAMWRADHEAWVGTEASVEQAITLNPWEPSYDMRLGQAAESSYQHEPTSSQAAPLLEAAVGFLRHEVDLDGADTYAQTDYAGALEALGNLQHSSSLFRMSLAALHTAKQEDPFNTSVAPLIKADEKGLGSS